MLIEFSFGVALSIFMFNSSGQISFFNKHRELWKLICRTVFTDAAVHFAQPYLLMQQYILLNRIY
jgi:hypothetical protein